MTSRVLESMSNNGTSPPLTRILARLNDIQEYLQHKNNDFLQNLQNFLQRDYLDLLQQDAIFWKQKSRIHWLQQGDSNTTIFHITTKIRRKRNKILSLKDTVGNWLYEKTKFLVILKISSRTYLVPLTLPPCLLQTLGGILKPVHFISDLLSLLLTLNTICLVFNLLNHQVRIAYLQFVSKEPAANLMKEILQTGNILEQLNVTCIAVVDPKVAFPELISSYRPISLYNTVYKIISKLPVNQINLLLSLLIIHFQSNFLPGRKLTDNVIIIQELVHTLSIQ